MLILRACSYSRASLSLIVYSAKLSLYISNSLRLVNLTVDFMLTFYFLKSSIYFLNPRITALKVVSAGLTFYLLLLNAVIGLDWDWSFSIVFCNFSFYFSKTVIFVFNFRFSLAKRLFLSNLNPIYVSKGCCHVAWLIFRQNYYSYFWTICFQRVWSSISS